MAISLIGHPTFLFFFTCLFFWFTDYKFIYFPESGFPYVITLIFLNTVFFPAIVTYLIQQDVLLKARVSRFKPLLVTLIIYLATWYYLQMVAFPGFMAQFLLSLSIGIAVLLILNFRWKVSFHATGFGALWGLFLVLSITQEQMGMGPLVSVTLLAGLVGSARLWLSAHNNAELYAGYGIGVAVTIINILI